MKDKNGFTLPEVLTVITILAVIMILAISSAVRMLDQTKRKISEYDKQILLDAAKSYGEDLDKNNKSYYPTKDIVLSSKTIYKDSEVKGYEFKELVKEKNTIDISTNYLKENNYIDDKLNANCTINIQFETSVQDGYIVIDKISAKLGNDCQ